MWQESSLCSVLLFVSADVSQESLYMHVVLLVVSAGHGCDVLFPSFSRMYDLLRTLLLAILFFIEWSMFLTAELSCPFDFLVYLEDCEEIYIVR